MEVLLNIKDPIAQLLGFWSTVINLWSVVLRLALAVVFGAVIGCERASKRHAAGLRTFMLVFIAAAIAMMLDSALMKAAMPFPVLSAATVIGIAVIASNSILYTSKSQIKGLTTSVGLWTSTMVGLSIGAGLYTLSLIGFAVLLSCLSLFPAVETYLKNRSNHFEIQLELKSKNNLQDFVGVLRELGMKIDDIESNPAFANSGLSVYSVSLTIHSPELKKYKTHREIIQALRSLEYVYYIDELT